MAIFHLDVKTVSRSQGRSAVGAAAYRAAERILDVRQGIEFDYSKKKGVVYSEILAPIHAPEWVKDRAKLWNAVENVEKRKDSQLAREVLIALPQELTLSENIELIKNYCQTQFVDKGMIADINLHHDKAENPHAHILLTLREITQEGFGLKNRNWNKRELVFEQRKAWQEMANVQLQLGGHEVRIDCRSLKARGLELEPGLHLGPAAHHGAAQGQGEDFTRYVDHLEILRANGERIIEDPSIALKKVTQQQSTFTEFDMAKLANQYSADLAQYQAVLSAIKTHESVVTLGKDEYDNTVYSTRQMITLEHKMLNEAYELDSKKDHGVTIDNSLLADKTLIEGQGKALLYLLEAGDLKVMTGLAGTGKSYVMGVVREAYETAGFKVSGACLSGIAAQSLEEGSGIPSQTVDSKLLQWAKGINPLTAQDVFVVDEAGMLGTEKMESLLSHANAAGSKVILIHDPEQLSAIQFGAPSRAIAERFGQTALTDILRQKNPEMQQATLEFGTGQTKTALARYEALGALHNTAIDEKVARQLMIEAWASDRLEDKSQLMLAYTNESVKSLNEAARTIRIAAGEIEAGVVFKVDKGDRAFSVGDRVYFLNNDKRLAVKNGSLGTIQAIERNRFSILIDGKQPRMVSFDLSQYASLDHGYAATVCKSQGVTVDKSYILLSRYFDRHLTYVAGSRHRESVQFYSHLEDFKNRDELFKCLSRERSKSMAVDFAEARWIHPNAPDIHPAPCCPTQAQQALERQEIKILNTHLPDKTFSFARAYEQIKGFVQGIVKLSNQKEMLCVTQDHEVKLVPLEHQLDQHLGKEAHIHLGKETQVLNCAITEQNRGTEQHYEVVREGRTVERASIEKSTNPSLDRQQALQIERDSTQSLSKEGIEL